jgi:hypothetical protein
VELNPAQLLGPFLEAVGQIQNEAKNALNLPLNPAQREALESLSAELKVHRARFEEFGPAFLLEGGKQLQENQKRLEALQLRKDDLLRELEELRLQAQAGIAEAEHSIRHQSSKPAMVAPRPQTKVPEKAVRLNLTPGGQLRDLLTSTVVASQPPTRTLKRIGNIWEDWAQRANPPTPAPAEDELDEDEEDEGRAVR